MVRLSSFSNSFVSLPLCLVAALLAYAVLGVIGATYAASAPTRIVIGYPSLIIM
jgi:hypothetical protein